MLVAAVLKLESFSSLGVLADKVYEAYHEHNATQNEADTFCRERGGQLATIVDRNEQNNIKSKLQRSVDVSSYWIGATLDFMTQLTWFDGSEYGRWLCLRYITFLHIELKQTCLGSSPHSLVNPSLSSSPVSASITSSLFTPGSKPTSSTNP